MVQQAFAYIGLDWKKYVENDPRYYRPAEVDLLVGDPTKAKRILGREARTKFKDLVKLMEEADMVEVGDGGEKKAEAKAKVENLLVQS